MVYSNGFGVKILTETNQDKLQRGAYNYVALNNNTEYKLLLSNDRSTDAMAEVYIEGDQVGTWFIPARDSITIDRPANIARKFTFFRETDPRAISAGVTPGESLNGVVRVVFYPKKQQYIAIGSSPRIMTPTVPILPYGSQYGTVSGVQQRTPVVSPVSSPQIPQIPSPSLRVPTMASPPQAATQQVTQQALVGSQSQEALARGFTTTPLSPRQSMVAAYQSGATVLGRQSYQTFGTMRRFTDDEIDWANKTEILIRLIVKTDTNTFISTAESSGGNMWSKEFVAIRDATQPIPPRIDTYLPLL